MQKIYNHKKKPHKLAPVGLTYFTKEKEKTLYKNIESKKRDYRFISRRLGLPHVGFHVLNCQFYIVALDKRARTRQVILYAAVINI